MSSSISQVKYWLEGSSESANDANKAGNGARFLSYNVFLVLSVLGGYFALDHLYLRSPLSFLAKIIVNTFCFGIWWIYDAVQAIFNTEVVKVYGLGVPGLGPNGIAAGVLANEVADKKHMRFLIYAGALFFGGIFGMDSFIVGDRSTGIIRLLCLISVLFTPIALGWWVYGLFQFFTNTQSVLNTHSDFFGAPHESEASRLASRFPLLGFLFSPIETIKFFINEVVGEPIIQPVTKTIDKVTDTVHDTVELGRETISKSKEIVDQVSKTVEAAGKAMDAIPATSLYGSITPETLKQTMEQSSEKKLTGGSLSGGDSLNVLPYTLLGTFSVIALLGFLLTVYRSKNVSTAKRSSTASRDDVPPEPGIYRESNSQESSTPP
jgi:hypothetical protein